MLPQVHFGKVDETKSINWRDALRYEIENDDDELQLITSSDVIGMLGFDPEDEMVKKKSIRKPQQKDLKLVRWKAIDAEIKKYEPLFSKTAIKIFREQEREVINNLEANGVKVKGHIAGWPRDKVRAWLSEHKDKVSESNLDKAKWEKRTAELFEPAYKETLLSSGEARITEFSRTKAEVRIKFDLDNPRIVKFLKSKLRTVSKEITGTTFNAVDKVLKNGYEESMPLSKISSELRSMFDTAEKYRAELISRTEATCAYNAGDLEAVRQMDLGDQIRKCWLNEPDARDTHVEAGEKYGDGNGIPIDENFEVGKDIMDAPGGGDLAEENVNCRCSIVYEKSGE